MARTIDGDAPAPVTLSFDLPSRGARYAALARLVAVADLAQRALSLSAELRRLGRALADPRLIEAVRLRLTETDARSAEGAGDAASLPEKHRHPPR
ncbi:MAG: hypothetical protein ACFBWO_05970 [Paracoccaceae bacterium]